MPALQAENEIDHGTGPMTNIFFNMIQLDPTITIGEIAAIFVLSVTFIAAAVYTFFTYRLWRESHSQSLLSISPLLLLNIDKNKFSLLNLGNTAAVNAKLEPFYLFAKDEKKAYKLEFESILLIKPQEKIQINTLNFLNGKETITDISCLLNPPYNKEITLRCFRIQYCNVIGIPYVTELSVGHKGIHITRIKQLTGREKSRLKRIAKREEKQYQKYC